MPSSSDSFGDGRVVETDDRMPMSGGNPLRLTGKIVIDRMVGVAVDVERFPDRAAPDTGRMNNPTGCWRKSPET